MQCEFNYCIYHWEYLCILEEIEFDASGMCESCEMVTVPEKQLNQYKNRRLKAIKEIWKNYDKEIKR